MNEMKVLVLWLFFIGVTFWPSTAVGEAGVFFEIFCIVFPRTNARQTSPRHFQELMLFTNTPRGTNSFGRHTVSLLRDPFPLGGSSKQCLNVDGLMWSWWWFRFVSGTAGHDAGGSANATKLFSAKLFQAPHLHVSRFLPLG